MLRQLKVSVKWLKQGLGILFGLNLLITPKKTVFIADTQVNDFPSADNLIKIAKSSVRVARLFGFDPKVAFLSHSTFGKPSSRNTKHAGGY